MQKQGRTSASLPIVKVFELIVIEIDIAIINREIRFATRGYDHGQIQIKKFVVTFNLKKYKWDANSC